ncbi:acetamidase/formamidase family protein [Salinicoccus halodurans]|uniref:Amidase n=1 Tax=Salinicoccus halodurans TaxID=407035 RepID=A0A0F7D3P7_9STAP|nr:acetamidase/formamidase family protein [Salinicoccus halodurans]AKG72855.1 acetamidase [Salinicoccus halodurans]SFK75164.1 amidase [Salinicoccus halodurans]
MFHELSKDNYFYAMSKNNEPKLKVNPGDTVKIDSHDCFTGQIHSEENAFDGFSWDKINPASGPVYVNGMKPGDVLKVTIEKIDIGDTGVMVTGPEMGVMGNRLKDMDVRIYDVNNDKGTVDFGGLEIPINKMIGVIGVAPPNADINNGTPDTHGGNMDSVKVAEGAVLYLPVYHEGALFGLGDVHAAMADGEISVSGLEVEAEVTVKLEKAETLKTYHPVITDKDGVYMMVSDKDLNLAVDQSVHKMIDLLQPQTGLSLSEMTMLMSLVGQTQINQVVDPKKTARFFVPGYILNHYNIELK